MTTTFVLSLRTVVPALVWAVLSLSPAFGGDPAAGEGDRPPSPPEPAGCAEDCPMLEKKTVINAPLARVWNAWTTAEGIRSISAKSNIELKVGGPYEWFLDLPPDENGLRGGQGSRVLAFVPERMLAFSWTFPPSVPTLRAARKKTTVVVLFEEIAADTVELQLHALGWQPGEDWRAGWDYFDKAWGKVLAGLKQQLEKPAE